MSTSEITTASTSALADETRLTSPSPPRTLALVTITSGLPVSIKKPLLSRGKQQPTETKPVPTKWFQNRPPRKPYSSKELITLGNMPSNAQLRSMNSKPFISIRWKSGNSDEPIMLYESFPRALAIAFSNICRQSNGSSVIIVGSSRKRIKKVFDYMLESAKGQGCSPSPIPEQLRYCTYVRNAVDASLVDVPLLEQEYEARRIIIENNQVHSADVEEIYRDPTSKGLPVRDNVAKSIARKLASKTLKANPAYVKLLQDLPGFDADVKKALREFRKPLEEEKRRLAREAQRKLWAQQQKAARQAQAARREKDSTAPRTNTPLPMKPPPARITQPRTAVQVQTSLGIIWAAVPIDKDSIGKARDASTQNQTIAAKKASRRSDMAVEDHGKIKKQAESWADEMAKHD